MHYMPRIRKVVQNPFPAWYAADEGPYNDLPTACAYYKKELYVCPAEDDGAYVHHPLIIAKAGKFFVMWSEHPRDEDRGGQRTMFSISRNFGWNWDVGSVLEDRLGEISLGSSTSEWAHRPGCWVDVASGLYAVLDVFLDRKSGQVGMLAVPIDAETEAIGTPVWAYTLSGNAPTALSGFPQYEMASETVRGQITAKMDEPNNRPQWSTGAVGRWETASLIEGTGVITPAPFLQKMEFWRGYGSNPVQDRKLVTKRLLYTSEGQTIADESTIPDDPSTGKLRLLSDGMVGYLSNDYRDVAIRERMMYVETDPANWEFLPENVYNIAQGEAVETYYDGESKLNIGASYGDFIEVDGYIHCVYSVAKQDIHYVRFRRIAELRKPIVITRGIFTPSAHNLLLSIDAQNTTGWTIGGGNMATSIVESSTFGRTIPVGGSGLETVGGIIYGNTGNVGIIIGNASPVIATQTGPVCWVSVERPATLGGAKRFALYGAQQHIRFNAGGVAIGQFGFDNGQLDFPSANVNGNKYALIVQRNADNLYEAHRWNGSAWVVSTNTFEMTEDIVFETDDECEFTDNDEVFLLQLYGKYFAGADLENLKTYLQAF